MHILIFIATIPICILLLLLLEQTFHITIFFYIIYILIPIHNCSVLRNLLLVLIIITIIYLHFIYDSITITTTTISSITIGVSIIIIISSNSLLYSNII